MRLPADERRQQLLAVARELFARSGFHDTSMDDIAEAAGVTKPVLYQHFPSKRALYVELLDDTGRQLLDRLAEATEPRDVRPRTGRGRASARTSSSRSATASSFRLLFGASIRSDPEFAAHRRGDPAGRRRHDLDAHRAPDLRRPAPRARERARRHGRVGRAPRARPSRGPTSTATSSRRGSPSSRGSACAACAPTNDRYRGVPILTRPDSQAQSLRRRTRCTR